MKQVETEIEIAAPVGRVWQVLTEDMPRAPEAFGITRFEGRIADGARIKIWSEVAPERAFALTVAELEAPQRMVWRGGMPLGLFTGTRTFTVTERAGGSRFAMREVFTGPMAGLITRSMPDLRPSFETFARTLKEKAEMT